MYAIVKSGSKQYRVEKGDKIHVDLLPATPGQEIGLNEVLFLSKDDGSIEVGKPTVHGCSVTARYIAETKGPKIQSVKYKKRKNERRKFGHRQRYAHLEIVNIQQG